MPIGKHKHDWYPITDLEGRQTGTLEVYNICGKEQGTADADAVKRHNMALDRFIETEAID